jgi:hypothetical protein
MDYCVSPLIFDFIPEAQLGFLKCGRCAFVKLSQRTASSGDVIQYRTGGNGSAWGMLVASTTLATGPREWSFTFLDSLSEYGVGIEVERSNTEDGCSCNVCQQRPESFHLFTGRFKGASGFPDLHSLRMCHVIDIDKKELPGTTVKFTVDLVEKTIRALITKKLKKKGSIVVETSDEELISEKPIFDLGTCRPFLYLRNANSTVILEQFV